MVFPVIFAAVFLAHGPLLRLPYYWDEAGYYIPAALDFLRTGSLVPTSTLTNAHPPLPSIYLAFWWKLSGFTAVVTRTAVCLVAAFALLGVFALARHLTNSAVASATVLLTALYPVWFAQSTLAHSDIFAAAATLWALYFCLSENPSAKNRCCAVACFSVAVLSKETAIATPLALGVWELILLLRAKNNPQPLARFWNAFLYFTPLVPLALWYAWHRHVTGFVFGNPEYLRYNATATLTPLRILLALMHRVLQVTAGMNMFVPVMCMIACMFLPALPEPRKSPQSSANTFRPPIHWDIQSKIYVVIAANLLLFSVLGGALLTRYLLPIYPLVILVCVNTFRRRVSYWGLLALFSAAAFIAGILVNPPYGFAPEDNLAYRDMIVLHQQAISLIAHQWPQSVVLTAWPATDELGKPDLGYVRKPILSVGIEDFSAPQIARAAAEPGLYNMALIFSTKYEPDSFLERIPLIGDSQWNRRYFGFHHDLQPETVARQLHGIVVWQQQRNGFWIAILRFDRIEDAALRSAQNPDILSLEPSVSSR